MVLGGPITFTAADWSAFFASAMVLVTVTGASSAAIVVGATRARRGPTAVARGAVGGFVVVALVGTLIGVLGSAAIRSQPSGDEAGGAVTTTFVPVQRPDDHLELTGDAVVAESVRAELELALAPLAATGAAPTTPEVDAVLTSVLGPDAPYPTSVTDDGLGGVMFVAEAADGCLSGSVRPGEVDVVVEGYIRDGGCIAATGH